MNILKQTGLILFLLALGAFISLLFLTRYEVNDTTLQAINAKIKDQHQAYVAEELAKLKGQQVGGKFSYIGRVKKALASCNEAIAIQFSVTDDAIRQYVKIAMVEENGTFTLTEDSRARANQLLPEEMEETLNGYTSWLVSKTFSSEEEFLKNATAGVKGAVDGFVNNKRINTEDEKNYLYDIVKATSTGPFWNHKFFWFLFIIVGGTLGALMYIYPAFFDGMPGIKHNGIYHSSAMNRGLIGTLIGVFLIGFYVLLYFYHYTIIEWISLTDPVSQVLRGEPATQWFMYGFLYTIAIIVMGVRMFAKYRHSNYHKVRTASVIFFQLSFAFLIPQILYTLNLPEVDLKNAWVTQRNTDNTD